MNYIYGAILNPIKETRPDKCPMASVLPQLTIDLKTARPKLDKNPDMNFLAVQCYPLQVILLKKDTDHKLHSFEFELEQVFATFPINWVYNPNANNATWS